MWVSALRRAEIGARRHIVGAYLLRNVQSPHVARTIAGSPHEQVSRVASLAMKRGKSAEFIEYWQDIQPSRSQSRKQRAPFDL
jgi:hypothetical protein